MIKIMRVSTILLFIGLWVPCRVNAIDLTTIRVILNVYNTAMRFDGEVNQALNLADDHGLCDKSNSEFRKLKNSLKNKQYPKTSVTWEQLFSSEKTVRDESFANLENYRNDLYNNSDRLREAAEDLLELSDSTKDLMNKTQALADKYRELAKIPAPSDLPGFTALNNSLILDDAAGCLSDLSTDSERMRKKFDKSADELEKGANWLDNNMKKIIKPAHLGQDAFELGNAAIENANRDISSISSNAAGSTKSFGQAAKGVLDSTRDINSMSARLSKDISQQLFNNSQTKLKNLQQQQQAIDDLKKSISGSNVNPSAGNTGGQLGTGQGGGVTENNSNVDPDVSIVPSQPVTQNPTSTQGNRQKPLTGNVVVPSDQGQQLFLL